MEVRRVLFRSWGAGIAVHRAALARRNGLRRQPFIWAVPRPHTRRGGGYRRACDRRTQGALSSADDQWRMVRSDGAHRKRRSEEHTSELQSLMRISYAVFCLKNKTQIKYTADRTL